MSTKHNTKHNRGGSGYGQKVADQGGGKRTMSDPTLSDGKKASAKR
jgi:hypothetical protein